jgi:hypothetical protein
MSFNAQRVLCFTYVFQCKFGQDSLLCYPDLFHTTNSTGLWTTDARATRHNTNQYKVLCGDWYSKKICTALNDYVVCSHYCNAKHLYSENSKLIYEYTWLIKKWTAVAKLLKICQILCHTNIYKFWVNYLWVPNMKHGHESKLGGYGTHYKLQTLVICNGENLTQVQIIHLYLIPIKISLICGN